MNMKDWMELIDYRITEGSEYLWDCFGSNAYSLTYWNQDHDGHSTNILFDTQSHQVYIVEVCDYKNSKAYRYINPEFKDEYFNEVKTRNVDDTAWDNVHWIDLEDYNDWKEKAYAILNDQPYDTRVKIPIELSDEELLVLFKMAHDRDITFNQLVESAIEELMKNLENDPINYKKQLKKKSKKG
jgi:hypothetical protein